MSFAHSTALEREPGSRLHSTLHSAGLVLLSSLLIGLFAKVAIPLPFTPIPFATQGLVVLILSLLLGSKRAPAAVLGFLMQGAAGLPVFAGGHSSLLGPTGGYLFGYLVASLLVGYLSEKIQSRTPIQLFWTLAAGNAMFYLFGVPYLAAFIGLKKALLLGLAPFVIGDLIKLILGVKIVQYVAKFTTEARE
jgi:biotin transport system substrate-specific component